MQIRVKYNLSMTPEGKWKLQAWVSDCGDDDDPNIFVYQAVPAVPAALDPPVLFAGVAGRAEMEEYPRNTPEGTLAFYRVSSMNITLESSIEMHRALASMTRDVELLVRSYEKVPA